MSWGLENEQWWAGSLTVKHDCLLAIISCGDHEEGCIVVVSAIVARNDSLYDWLQSWLINFFLVFNWGLLMNHDRDDLLFITEFLTPLINSIPEATIFTRGNTHLFLLFFGYWIVMWPTSNVAHPSVNKATWESPCYSWTWNITTCQGQQWSTMFSWYQIMINHCSVPHQHSQYNGRQHMEGGTSMFCMCSWYHAKIGGTRDVNCAGPTFAKVDVRGHH